MSYPSVLFHKAASETALFAMSIIFGSSLSMGVVLFTCYARKYPEFLKICTFLGKFDHDLQLESPEYWITENVPIIVISTVTPIILEGSKQYAMSMMEEHELVIRRIIAYFYVTAALCGKTVMLIHFQHVACGIAKRFRLVNSWIRLLVMKESLRLSVLRRNPPYVDRRQDYTSCKKFKSLLSAYHLLCDAVYQANVFYGYLLLATIFCTFITITECLYFFSLFIIDGKVIISVTISIWIFNNATFLVLIARCGSHVSEMAGDTAPLIRKLINENVGSGLREELKSFLLQLVGTNVEFNAGGFFQINKETLTSIAAAVTTYLVIMIQFETQSK
ncbi:gustatory receptor [Homalodisca vitripennis]|nr:gustatory receptor [Homalodisca vitripennis]